MVEIFPEVLSHQAEGTEEGPAKSVKICVPVIWVFTEPLRIKKVTKSTRKETKNEKGLYFEELEFSGVDHGYLETDVILRTGTSPTGVSTQLVVLHLRPPVPVRVVVVELHPRRVTLPPSPVHVFQGEVLNALLCEHAHINLEAQKGKN